MSERERKRERRRRVKRGEKKNDKRQRKLKNVDYNRVMYFMTGFNTVLIAIFNCNLINKGAI